MKNKFKKGDAVLVVSGPQKDRKGVVLSLRSIITHHRWKTTNTLYAVHFGSNDRDEFGEDELQLAKL